MLNENIHLEFYVFVFLFIFQITGKICVLNKNHSKLEFLDPIDFFKISDIIFIFQEQ